MTAIKSDNSREDSLGVIKDIRRFRILDDILKDMEE